ncbi:DUF4328 domain-containing protein [Yinghuangia sp. YIM S09857]|uniref:DUF4328 domain-containing protein n=1 Tax=Yinghuangia sp. YIM S09857 TaxID=3436929 RepID=UPI003F52B931
MSTGCTNCGGTPAGSADATPNRPDAADDIADDEAAWRWEEDRDDVAWRPAADTVGALESAKRASGLWDPYVPQPARHWQLWQIKSVGGLATALYALLGVTTAATVVLAVAAFRRAGLVEDFADDPFGSVTLAELESADDFVIAAALFHVVLLTATGVVFVIWFFRARKNVELFGLHQPSLGRGWAIGGWVCPAVNLWFPARIAHDIWKGSDAWRGSRDSGKLFGRSVLITCWWVLFMGMWALTEFSDLMAGSDGERDSADDMDDFVFADRLSGTAELLMALSGVFAIMLVRRITALQNERTAQLWAMSGPPATWGTPPVAWSPGGFPVPLPPQAPLPQQAPQAPMPQQAPQAPQGQQSTQATQAPQDPQLPQAPRL